MILADKIIELRKRAGLSQEQLAEELGVSRQAVSKWESAQSTPDMNKILALAGFFGVSTDFLLKDDLEMTDNAPTQGSTTTQDSVCSSGEALTPVSMEVASTYLMVNRGYAYKTALGVMMCILSPILLVVFSGLQESGRLKMTENQAAMIGVIILILLVASAVLIFVLNSSKMSKYEFLSEDSLDTAYGISGMAREQREAFEGQHVRELATGVALCVVSVIPVLAAAFFAEEDEGIMCAAVGVLLAIVSFGTYLIVRTSMIWSGFQILLEEGDYTREEKKFGKKIAPFATIYWCIMTAGYLLVSFLTNRWDITWVVWPVAGIMYGVLVAIIKATARNK